MASDRIERLHNEASEHYLNGNYEAALEAWKAVLQADPGHAEALEGVRMAGLLSDKAPTDLGDLPVEEPPLFDLPLSIDGLDTDPGLDVGATPAAPARGSSKAPVPPAPEAGTVAAARPPSADRSPEGEIDRSLEAFFELMPNPLAAKVPPLEPDALESAAAEPHAGAPLPAFDPLAEVASPPSDVVAGPNVADLDPERQGEGIDFGDVETVSAIPLAGESAGTPDPTASADNDAFSLEPLPESERRRAGPPSSEPSPAAIELRRRVGALLRDAKTKMDEGDREGALGIIARVYILDEDNAEARAFETQLRENESRDLVAIDQWLTEGIQVFDAGRVEEAKDLFHRVLAQSPGHREALHYLEAISEREAPTSVADEDLLAGSDIVGAGPTVEAGNAPPPGEQAIGLARDASSVPLATDDASPEAPVPDVPRSRPRRGADAAVPVPRFRRATPKWVYVVGAAIVVLAGAALLVPKFLDTGSDGAPDATAPVPRKAARPTHSEPSPEASASPAPAPSLAQTLQRADRALRSGDYGAAVIAYNEAIKIDPTSDRARAGLDVAAERYRAEQAEREQLERVRIAFNDGEFASALRVMYRLPDSVDRATVERWKAAGWFNLGVVALRAGEPAQAIGHFDEVLAIRPDPDAERWRTFAVKHRHLAKDRSYFAPVEAIAFRRLED